MDRDGSGAGLGLRRHRDRERSTGLTWIDATANRQARAFYERLGFVFDHEVATVLGVAPRLHIDVVPEPI